VRERGEKTGISICTFYAKKGSKKKRKNSGNERSTRKALLGRKTQHTIKMQRELPFDVDI
jgi:hypothetical protein